MRMLSEDDASTIGDNKKRRETRNEEENYDNACENNLRDTTNNYYFNKAGWPQMITTQSTMETRKTSSHDDIKNHNQFDIPKGTRSCSSPEYHSSSQSLVPLSIHPSLVLTDLLVFPIDDTDDRFPTPRTSSHLQNRQQRPFVEKISQRSDFNQFYRSPYSGDEEKEESFFYYHHHYATPFQRFASPLEGFEAIDRRSDDRDYIHLLENPSQPQQHQYPNSIVRTRASEGTSPQHPSSPDSTSSISHHNRSYSKTRSLFQYSHQTLFPAACSLGTQRCIQSLSHVHDEGLDDPMEPVMMTLPTVDRSSIDVSCARRTADAASHIADASSPVQVVRHLQPCEEKQPQQVKSVYSFSKIAKSSHKDGSFSPMSLSPKCCQQAISYTDQHRSTATNPRGFGDHDVTTITVASNGLLLVVFGLCFILSGSYGLLFASGSYGGATSVFQQRLKQFFLYQSNTVSYAFLLWGFLFGGTGAALSFWVYRRSPSSIRRPSQSSTTPADSQQEQEQHTVLLFDKPPPHHLQQASSCHDGNTDDAETDGACADGACADGACADGAGASNRIFNEDRTREMLCSPLSLHRSPTTHQISIPLVTVIV